MKIITYALSSVALAATLSVAQAGNVPDALSVEWQGNHPCEKLFEDAQVRVARCTFPPGAMHVCHSHPSYLSYVVSDGQAQIRDEKGVRKVNAVAGALADVPPTPWHELTNESIIIMPETVQGVSLSYFVKSAGRDSQWNGILSLR